MSRGRSRAGSAFFCPSGATRPARLTVPPHLDREIFNARLRRLAGGGAVLKVGQNLLPKAHRVVSLRMRWILGTHQGAIGKDHLQAYLDEFIFRFNRRSSRSRGLLFYRLIRQTMSHAPCPRLGYNEPITNETA